MDIQINLYRDTIELVNAKIDQLKKSGFKFKEYSHWERARKERLAKGREQAVADGRETRVLDQLSETGRLKQAFKIDQVFRYLDFQYRIPDDRPRSILYSSDFSCPSKRQTGLRMVEDEIRSGTSLFRRLSRQIFDADAQDGLLFDWGIFHLHLGTGPDKRHPTLIEGHAEVLFVIMDATNAYFLCVGDHTRWADEDLLRIVKRDFPSLIEPYRMDAISPGTGITPKQRMALRSAGVNPLPVIDGTVYFSPGGGINSARGSMRSTTRLQQIIHWYNRAEEIIRTHLQELPEKDKAFPLQPDASISLEMKELSNDSIAVVDDKHNLQITLTYTADRTDFDQIEVVC